MGVLIDYGFIARYAKDAGTEASSRLKAAKDRSSAPHPTWVTPSGGPAYFNYVDNSWNWGGRNNVVYQDTGCSKDETGKPSYGFSAFLGLMAAVLGAGVSGYLYQGWVSANTSLEEVEGIARVIKSGKWAEGVSHEIRDDFEKLVNTQLKIHRMISSNSTDYLVAAAGVLAGGVSLAVGAVTMTAWWMTAGQVVLVAAAVLSAWNFGMHYHDEDQLRKLYGVIAGKKGQIGLAEAICAKCSPFSHPVTYVQLATGQTPVDGVPVDPPHRVLGISQEHHYTKTA